MEPISLKFSAKEGTMSVVEPIYTTQRTCRACHSAGLLPVLDLGVQYLPRFVPEPDLGLPKAPLQLVRCATCDLLQLGHSVKADLLFRRYWYRSSINGSMKVALQQVVDHGLQYFRQGKWLDIGANDGYLLSQVPRNFRKVACEPSLDFQESLEANANQVVNEYFSADKFVDTYDVITSVACFYDVDEPGKFVGDVAKLLSPDGVWINQLNDAPTMLRKNAFDSVCHEHVAYYDVPTLERLYREHGLTITRLTHNEVNGGSVRVTARKSTRQREDMLGVPKTSPEEVELFAKRVGKWRDRMHDLCDGPFALGGTYLYGASTKLMVMLQYLGETSCFIAAAERNPLKYGLRMAGSWTPIISEDEMRGRKPKYIVVGPWGLSRDEFLARERQTLAEGATFVWPLPSIELTL